jgi:predicted acyl esterase
MVQAWIPMKDGVHLAATLYMPDGAKPVEKFPARWNTCPIAKMMARRRAIIPNIHISRGADT